jgi:hypothetical protein
MVIFHSYVKLPEGNQIAINWGPCSIFRPIRAMQKSPGRKASSFCSWKCCGVAWIFSNAAVLKVESQGYHETHWYTCYILLLAAASKKFNTWTWRVHLLMVPGHSWAHFRASNPICTAAAVLYSRPIYGAGWPLEPFIFRVKMFCILPGFLAIPFHSPRLLEPRNRPGAHLMWRLPTRRFPWWETSWSPTTRTIGKERPLGIKALAVFPYVATQKV